MTLDLVPFRGHTVPVLNGRSEISRYSLQQYLRDTSFSFNGMTYHPGNSYGITTTYNNRPAEPISYNFAGFVEGMLYADGPVAAAEAYRLRVFGQAPLLYQELIDGRPGDLFDDDALERLREPWPAGNLGDLAKRALIYGDFAGNAFVLDIDDELVLVRPDWVEIVLAKREHRGGQVGWRQMGIVYYEGGLGTGDGVTFLPGEYAHFVPNLPDPLATYRGMSWLTPLVREVQADISASAHKLAFFENAASPNLAVSLPKEITPEQFKKFVSEMDDAHKGVANAYKTLYTAGGADVTVIGANMQQMDFSSVQGKGETRIANLAGVPPVLLSFSEGMQGSSLNAGNYTAAKRNFVDTTMRDLWQNWAGSLQKMDAFRPPKAKSRLWYDGRDIPFLHEDAKDRAEIQQIEAATLSSHISAGWEPETAVEALLQDDLRRLKHTGLTSVQLVPPGTAEGSPEDVAAEEEYDVLLDEFRSRTVDDEIQRDRYDVRNPAGSVGGGRFRKLSDAIVALLRDAEGDEDPLEDLTQPQLKKAAEQLGLTEPRKRYTKAQLKVALLKHARGDAGKKAAPKAPVDRDGEAEALLSAQSAPRLRRLATAIGAQVPDSATTKPAIIAAILRDVDRSLTIKDDYSSTRYDRLSLIQEGLDATERPTGPGDVDAAVDRVRTALAGGGSSAEVQGRIIRELASDPGLTSAKLRKVAEALHIDLPEDMRAKTSMQMHIAEHAPNVPEEIFHNYSLFLEKAGVADSELKPHHRDALQEIADRMNAGTPGSILARDLRNEGDPLLARIAAGVEHPDVMSSGRGTPRKRTPAKKATPRAPLSDLNPAMAEVRRLVQERRQRRLAMGIGEEPTETEARRVLDRLTVPQLKQLHEDMNIAPMGSRATKPALIRSLWEEATGHARRIHGDDMPGRLELVDRALELVEATPDPESAARERQADIDSAPGKATAEAKREADAEDADERADGLYVAPRHPAMNTPYAAGAELDRSHDQDQADDALEGLTLAELREVAKAKGVTVSGRDADTVRRQIVEGLTAKRRDWPPTWRQDPIVVDRALERLSRVDWTATKGVPADPARGHMDHLSLRETKDLAGRIGVPDGLRSKAEWRDAIVAKFTRGDVDPGVMAEATARVRQHDIDSAVVEEVDEPAPVRHPSGDLDIREIGDGLDLSLLPDAVVDDLQAMLSGEDRDTIGPNPTPAAVGRYLEKWANGPAGPFYRAATLDPIREGVDADLREQYHREGAVWLKLAERLKATRRRRAKSEDPDVVVSPAFDRLVRQGGRPLPSAGGTSMGQPQRVSDAPTPDPLSSLRILRTLDPEATRDALDLKKVPDLKAMLRDAGLPVSGRKRDLVDRLVGHLHPGGGEGAGPEADVTPELRREIEVENRIRAAYREIDAEADPANRGRVGLNGLRDRLGDLPRGEVDDAIRRLTAGKSGARVTSIEFGGNRSEFLTIDDPSDRPLPAPRADLSVSRDERIRQLMATGMTRKQATEQIRQENASRSTEPDEDEISRALADLTDDEFEKYWTREEGLGRWSTHPHPWTTLRNLLRQIPFKHGGRGPRDPEGLASHYFKIVFGFWPGERKGSNPVGPG